MVRSYKKATQTTYRRIGLIVTVLAIWAKNCRRARVRRSLGERQRSAVCRTVVGLLLRLVVALLELRSPRLLIGQLLGDLLFDVLALAFVLRRAHQPGELGRVVDFVVGLVDFTGELDRLQLRHRAQWGVRARLGAEAVQFSFEDVRDGMVCACAARLA